MDKFEPSPYGPTVLQQCIEALKAAEDYLGLVQAPKAEEIRKQVRCARRRLLRNYPNQK
jgi:hypothetical protein